jgi:hypothetical protein
MPEGRVCWFWVSWETFDFQETTWGTDLTYASNRRCYWWDTHIPYLWYIKIFHEKAPGYEAAFLKITSKIIPNVNGRFRAWPPLVTNCTKNPAAVRTWTVRLLWRSIMIMHRCMMPGRSPKDWQSPGSFDLSIPHTHWISHRATSSIWLSSGTIDAVGI